MSYIVIWDDGMGLSFPMGWDDDCEGAICGCGYSGGIAAFVSRADARKAIRISAANARLLIEQQKLQKENSSDFLGRAAKNLKIIPLKAKLKQVKP